MHQRSWLAVKPTRKSNPPPATPPMLGRSSQPKKRKPSKEKHIKKDNSISEKELSLRKIRIPLIKLIRQNLLEEIKSTS